MEAIGAVVDVNGSNGKAVETVVVEEPTSPGAEAPPTKRKRGPNKPTGDFVGGMRALAIQHRDRCARVRKERDQLRERLAAKEAELADVEGPLHEVEAILARHPELPLVEQTA